MNIQSVMTPRLYAIADSVPQGAALADVGTDHGYIPIYLQLNKQIKSALAMDLRPGPLQHARENIAKFGLDEQIKTRLSDGLGALCAGEADTAVVAGMGGLLIAEILQKAPVLLSCYILQPMTATAELRAYLAQNGFKIIKEKLVREEEKIYTVMTVVPGEMAMPAPVHLQVGTCLMKSKDPLVLDLIHSLQKKYTAALAGLNQSDRQETYEKKVAYHEMIESLSKLEKECEAW